jgi:hypothetical protein
MKGEGGLEDDTNHEDRLPGLMEISHADTWGSLSTIKSASNNVEESEKKMLDKLTFPLAGKSVVVNAVGAYRKFNSTRMTVRKIDDDDDSIFCFDGISYVDVACGSGSDSGSGSGSGFDSSSGSSLGSTCSIIQGTGGICVPEDEEDDIEASKNISLTNDHTITLEKTSGMACPSARTEDFEVGFDSGMLKKVEPVFYAREGYFQGQDATFVTRNYTLGGALSSVNKMTILTQKGVIICKRVVGQDSMSKRTRFRVASASDRYQDQLDRTFDVKMSGLRIGSITFDRGEPSTRTCECFDTAEERIALVAPTKEVVHAADQMLDNFTAENMHSVYKIMDCKDQYTTPAQKVLLAAATTTAVSTVLVGAKALIGSYETFNELTDSVKMLEKKLDIADDKLDDCKDDLEEKSVALEVCDADLKVTELKLDVCKDELVEKKTALEVCKDTLVEREAKLEICEDKLDKVEEALENREDEVDKLKDALEVVLDLVEEADDVIDDALGNDSDLGSDVPDSDLGNDSDLGPDLGDEGVDAVGSNNPDKPLGEVADGLVGLGDGIVDDLPGDVADADDGSDGSCNSSLCLQDCELACSDDDEHCYQQCQQEYQETIDELMNDSPTLVDNNYPYKSILSVKKQLKKLLDGINSAGISDNEIVLLTNSIDDFNDRANSTHTIKILKAIQIHLKTIYVSDKLPVKLSIELEIIRDEINSIVMNLETNFQ